jgi:hypothetical protein
MLRKVTLIVSVLALSLVMVGTASANPGKPSFGPQLYGDGELWGTKGAAALPAPNGEKNLQSFDKLFVIVDENYEPRQLPVAEAAPGNPDYNGGRWFTHTVMWKEGAEVVTLKSYKDIMDHGDDLNVRSSDLLSVGKTV